MKGPLASEGVAPLTPFCRVMFSPASVILDLLKDKSPHVSFSLIHISASVRVRPTKWVLEKGEGYQEM